LGGRGAGDGDVEAYALPSDGDLGRDAHRAARVPVAGHLDVDAFDRHIEAGAPDAVAHGQPGAEAGAQQLARVGAAALAALGLGLVGSQAAAVVLDLAGEAGFQTNPGLRGSAPERRAPRKGAGLAPVQLLDRGRVHGAGSNSAVSFRLATRIRPDAVGVAEQVATT